MSELFGGHKETGGADAIANANIAIAQQNAQAEKDRLATQQANEQKTASDLAAQQAQQQADAQKALDAATAKQQQDAKSFAATGGTPSAEDLQQQKLAKAQAAANLGLPGFDTLSNRFGTSKSLNGQNAQNAQQAGYLGQSNSLVSKNTKNQPQVAAAGGQRFY